MYRLFINSGSAILYHPQHVVISTVAVYDRNLLRPFMEGFVFKGNPRAAEQCRQAVAFFLEQWDAGDDRVAVEAGGLSLSIYRVGYIEREKGLIELGTRPPNPYRDILVATQQLARCMGNNSCDCANRYKELQDLLQKYPQLPAIKERA